MIIVYLLAMLCLPSVIDAVVRLLLTVKASQGRMPTVTSDVDDWLVVIPSRSEGRNLDRTLSSIEDATGTKRVTTLVVLDGEDAESRVVADSWSAEVLLKAPPGPGKGAVLEWLSLRHGDRLRRAHAILLLDVGSTLPKGFFDRFCWPAGADVVQCVLSGEGDSVAQAISRSETFAQAVEDVGRQRLGWNARIRGTGTCFTSKAFLRSCERLVTHVEDLEASLVLTIDGRRIVTGPPELAVIDTKPTEVGPAAAQRARWMWGTISLAVQRPGLFGALIVRRPGEGLAFIGQLLGRPISLSLLFRAFVAVVLVRVGEGVLPTTIAAVLLLTVASDVLSIATSTSVKPAAVVKLMVVWMLAILLLPRAAMRWLRARQRS